MIFSDAYIEELSSYPREDGFMDGLIPLDSRDLGAAEKNAYDACTRAARELESCILLWLRPSRETSLAITNLEQAMMWADKSIMNNGVTGE